MIDIGANLANKQFDKDLDDVLLESRKAGVDSIILTTTNVSSFFKNIDIMNLYSNFSLYTTIGIHPHHAAIEGKEIENFFLNVNKFNNIVAIGEIGLDYNRDLVSKKIQIKTFEKQLELSRQTLLPLFLHERDAVEDMINIIKNSDIKNKKIIHCFTSNKDNAKIYLDIDCYFGITGWVCDERRNSELIEAIEYIPIDRLMIETDSPYLIPRELNKELKYRNNPSSLSIILKKIAQIKNINIEVINEQIMKNTANFFNINYKFQKNNTKQPL